MLLISGKPQSNSKVNTRCHALTYACMTNLSLICSNKQEGKCKVVLHLRYSNQYLWKDSFKQKDIRITLLLLTKMISYLVKSGYHHLSINRILEGADLANVGFIANDTAILRNTATLANTSYSI